MPNVFPNDPTEFVFLDGEKDQIRIHSMTFKKLIGQYQNSGEPDSEIDELVKTNQDNSQWK